MWLGNGQGASPSIVPIVAVRRKLAIRSASPSGSGGPEARLARHAIRSGHRLRRIILWMQKRRHQTLTQCNCHARNELCWCRSGIGQSHAAYCSYLLGRRLLHMRYRLSARWSHPWEWLVDNQQQVRHRNVLPTHDLTPSALTRICRLDLP